MFHRTTGGSSALNCVPNLKSYQQWSYRNQSHRPHGRADVGSQRPSLRKLDTSIAPAGFPDPQVKHPHDACPSEVRDLPRLVVLHVGFVLAKVDLLPGLRDLGNTWEWALLWTDLPDDRSTSFRPLRERFSSCTSEDFTRL